MADLSDRIEQYVQDVQNVQNVQSMGADFLREVFRLIQAIGYEMTDGDSWLVGFCVQKIEQEIKNACNVPSVPLGLYKCASGLVAADFLTLKRANGKLDADSLNFEPALKQIREGDTELTYATETALSGEQRLNLFLAACYQGREQLIAYRRLKW